MGSTLQVDPVSRNDERDVRRDGDEMSDVEIDKELYVVCFGRGTCADGQEGKLRERRSRQARD